MCWLQKSTFLLHFKYKIMWRRNNGGRGQSNSTGRSVTSSVQTQLLQFIIKSLNTKNMKYYCMHELKVAVDAHTRSIQSTVQNGGEGSQALTLNQRNMERRWLLRKGELVYFKGAVPVRSTALQLMAPNLGVY